MPDAPSSQFSPKSDRVPTGSQAHAPEFQSGRLAVYAALGAGIGALPVPWLPDTLMVRVRSALLDDVVSRHACPIEIDAHEVLASPHAVSEADGVVAQAVRYVRTRLLRRVGPIGVLPPLQFAVHTFALGHLVDRYLRLGRPGSTAPNAAAADSAAAIGVSEAKRVRRAIDIAVGRALLTRGAGLDRGVGKKAHDTLSEFIDGVLRGAAGVPEWAESRLDAAFDLALGVERDTTARNDEKAGNRRG